MNYNIGALLAILATETKIFTYVVGEKDEI